MKLIQSIKFLIKPRFKNLKIYFKSTKNLNQIPMNLRISLIKTTVSLRNLKILINKLDLKVMRIFMEDNYKL